MKEKTLLLDIQLIFTSFIKKLISAVDLLTDYREYNTRYGFGFEFLLYDSNQDVEELRTINEAICDVDIIIKSKNFLVMFLKEKSKACKWRNDESVNMWVNNNENMGVRENEKQKHVGEVHQSWDKSERKRHYCVVLWGKETEEEEGAKNIKKLRLVSKL